MDSKHLITGWAEKAEQYFSTKGRSLHFDRRRSSQGYYRGACVPTPRGRTHDRSLFSLLVLVGGATNASPVPRKKNPTASAARELTGKKIDRRYALKNNSPSSGKGKKSDAKKPHTTKIESSKRDTGHSTMADADHDDGAERACFRLSVSWTRSVFVIGVALVLVLNAALVGAVLASVAMRQQEGDLYRDRLVNLLYTAVWCSSAAAVAAAAIEAWRGRQRLHQNHTMQDTPDTARQCAVPADVAFAARVCNRTWRHKRPDHVMDDGAGVRECTWRVVTWHCIAPGVVTFVATGADDRAPFEAHGTSHRPRTDGVFGIAWTQTCTVPSLPGGDARMRATRFFSGAVEPNGLNQDDVIRGLQTQTAPPPKENWTSHHECTQMHLASSSELVFYSRADGDGRDGNDDKGRGLPFVPADYAVHSFSLATDSLV